MVGDLELLLKRAESRAWSALGSALECAGWQEEAGSCYELATLCHLRRFDVSDAQDNRLEALYNPNLDEDEDL